MTGAEGLYEEVHHLAYHYHWRERDILELARIQEAALSGLAGQQTRAATRE